METWHGTPDARVRGSPFVLQKKEKEESEESDAESTTMMEQQPQSKQKKFLASNLPQVISTCVVSSFTEKSLHPELPAMVPTILIDEKQF